MDTKDPYIYCLQETHLKTGDTYRLKVKGWKKIFHANRDQKKAGVAILISDKIDFKTKTVKRDKEGHYIMIKGSIQEEDITIINIYAPNTGAPQYVRQMLTSMIPLPFTLLFGVQVYTCFLCFLSREYPLVFVGELVWWCRILSAFACLRSF